MSSSTYVQRVRNALARLAIQKQKEFLSSKGSGHVRVFRLALDETESHVRVDGDITLSHFLMLHAHLSVRHLEEHAVGSRSSSDSSSRSSSVLVKRITPKIRQLRYVTQAEASWTS